MMMKKTFVKYVQAKKTFFYQCNETQSQYVFTISKFIDNVQISFLKKL